MGVDHRHGREEWERKMSHMSNLARCTGISTAMMLGLFLGCSTAKAATITISEHRDFTFVLENIGTLTATQLDVTLVAGTPISSITTGETFSPELSIVEDGSASFFAAPDFNPP
jgi:hypothetical protein